MKNKVNKKTICFIGSILLLLSALLYNILYINKEKNEIINEIEMEENNEIKEEMEEEKKIFVDIGGEVNNPGLYELSENARINDAINVAGGTTDKADLTDVNLAYVLVDAMKVIIPKKEDKRIVNNVTKSVPKIITDNIVMSESNSQVTNGKVNINTATKEQLKTLTGIGESTAQKIIDYRNENGRFNDIEDIKNVSGIGDSKFEKIKNNINI